jgi:hypothetical protein
MSTGAWRIKPSEIARTIKSLQSTGLPVRNVEICPDGTIRINTHSSVAEVPAAAEETSEQLRKLL